MKTDDPCGLPLVTFIAMSGMARVTRCLVSAVVVGLVTTATLVARADTTIDGGDLGGLVWTADKGPYHVSDTAGPLMVSTGKELRVGPGTVVMFAATLGARLIVDGKLIVEGTAAAPVVLRGEADGTNVTWPGIEASKDAASIQIAGAVIRNATYGLIVFRAADVHIDRTTVESCTVGLSFWRGTFAFDSLVLQNNTRGLEVEGNKPVPDTSVTLTNALLRGNTSHGATTVGTSPLTIINSTIDGNGSGASAWYGGASAAGATLVLDVQNTIFTNNLRAIDLDSASVPDASKVSATIAGSTFWNNRRNSEHKTMSGTVVVAPTDAPAGEGNMVEDPGYLSASDQHLVAGSPCIDTGKAPRAPDHDLDGHGRPHGAGFDRGAYEWRPGSGAGGEGGTGAGGAGGRSGAAGTAGNGGPPASGGTSGSGAVGGAGAGVGGRGGEEAGRGGQSQPPPAGGSSGGGGAVGAGGIPGAAGSAGAGAEAGAIGGAGQPAGGRTGAAGSTGSPGASSGSGCSCAVASGHRSSAAATAVSFLGLMIMGWRSRRRRSLPRIAR